MSIARLVSGAGFRYEADFLASLPRDQAQALLMGPTGAPLVPVERAWNRSVHTLREAGLRLLYRCALSQCRPLVRSQPSAPRALQPHAATNSSALEAPARCACPV